MRSDVARRLATDATALLDDGSVVKTVDSGSALPAE
jgi:hypothetical protein